MSFLGPPGPQDEAQVREALQWIDSVRIEGVLTKVREALPRAQEQNCGLLLQLADGWFVAVEASPIVPVGTMYVVTDSQAAADIQASAGLDRANSSEG